MKIKLIMLLIFSSLCLSAAVDQSIIPHMDKLVIKELQGKLNQEQLAEIHNLALDQRLRVISFNMLFDLHDDQLEPSNRWQSRKNKIAEYIQWSHPDIVGSQELQANQLEDLLARIGNEYAYYGVGIDDGLKKGDIPAIFYRKERIELILGQTFYFSKTPECVSNNPFGGKNSFTFGHFRDKKTGREFLVINTHLAFGNIERRYYEARKLRDFLQAKNFSLPLVITGDFNTFSFRQELDLPFYDGDQIIALIEQGCVADSSRKALLGHFGPIASTNFCAERKRAFCAVGTAGVILDHIFVSEGIQVVAHGIDPAQVNGSFPSDHLPVIIDMIVK